MIRSSAALITLLYTIVALAGCDTTKSKKEPAPRSQEKEKTSEKEPRKAGAEPVRSADWIASIPDSDLRRTVVIGCTPCHQLGPPAAHKTTIQDWEAVIQRMKILDDALDLALIPRKTKGLAQWLHEHSNLPSNGFAVKTEKADYREYATGNSQGFYHDVTVAAGRAWIADYFGNKLYGIDTESGEAKAHSIPVSVEKGKPGGAHQIDITRDGMIWITFTKSDEVIRFDPEKKKFRVYSGFEKGGGVQYFVMDVDRYIHEDKGGNIWVTYFSREILSSLNPETGKVTTYRTPRTEGFPEKGVHLYAAVADSKGRIWYTETHGNNLGVLDPETGEAVEFPMPEKHVGPKRLAIDEKDLLWIPELATGKISVYDTRAGKFVDRLQLPIPGDYPYGIRRNRYTGDLWVTGSGSDSLYKLDPKTKKFTVYRLPRLGTYTRTVTFTENGDIWTSYASFPNQHTQMPHRGGVVLRLRPFKGGGRATSPQP